MNIKQTLLTALALTLPLAGAKAQCTHSPAGLVGWWSGDGHNFDLSRSGYHGTNVGATYGAGEVGQCFDINGSRGDVLVGSQPGLLHFNNNFSFMAWLKPRTAGSSLADPILGKEGEYMLVILPNGHLATILANTWPGWGTESWRWVDSGFVAPTTSWTHAAVTYSNSVLRFYVNGTLRTTLECVGSIGDYWPYNNDFRIGGRGMNYWEYFYQGLVDEAAVFNRPLLGDEVAAIYAAGSAGMCRPPFPPPAGMTHWWPADQTTRDIGGGLDALLRGGAVYEAGTIGQAFSLNGDSQFVEVPDDPSLEVGTNDFTFEVWVRFNTLSGEQVIAEKYIETGSPARTGWTLTKMADNTIRVALAGGGDVDSLPAPTVTAASNTWTHFVMRRSGNTFTTFQDGTPTAAGTFGRNLDCSSSLKFGHRGNPADTPGAWDTRNFWLNGAIDEPALYHRALADLEIAALYAAGSAGKVKPPSLQIARAGELVRLFWPAEAAGYGLVSRTNLLSGNWASVTNAPGFNGDWKEVLLPAAASGQRFFRLHSGN